MVVSVFLCDIDGVMGNFSKDVAPWDEDLTQHAADLKRIRDYIESKSGQRFSACTGRSLESGKHVIELGGINGPSIFEMGNVVYDPITGDSFNITDAPEFTRLRDASSELEKWKYKILDNENGVFGSLLDEGAEIRFLKDRARIFTYEITKGGITGHDLFESLKPHLDGIGNYINRGKILVVASEKALDIQPAVDKKGSILYVAKRYGLNLDESVGIGDSAHSDIPMLEAVGYGACPSNSDQKIKDYVTRQGGRGYVSEGSYTDGLLEIFEHANRTWRN